MEVPFSETKIKKEEVGLEAVQVGGLAREQGGHHMMQGLQGQQGVSNGSWFLEETVSVSCYHEAV